MNRFCLTAFIALIAITAAAAPLHAEEAILNWHSDITVHEDASMSVTEHIKVRAEGNQIKRGIYREFPTVYKDRAGNRVTVDFTLLGVTRDGRPEAYHTQNMKNGVRIYAGKSDVFLDPGEYTYGISYRTDRQLGFFQDHDELYWNVTGNAWEFPIHKATAAVSLPPSIPAGTLQAAGYVGLQGSREQNIAWNISDDGRVVFSSRRPLGPREGLTIVLGWPKGYVSEPTRSDKAAFFLSDNRDLVAILAGLLILLIYYLWAWQRAGKDPEKGTVIPLFEPPDKLSPAAMRYIMEMGFDNKAFASAVIDLAVKGYLTISEESKAFGLKRTYTLHRTGDDPSTPLSKGEQKLARKLFPGSSMTLELEQSNHHKISTAMETLKDLLREEYHKSSFVNNSGYVGFGVLISIAIIVLIGIGGKNSPGGPPLLFILLWFIPWTGVTLFLWGSHKFFMAAIFSFFLLGAGFAFSQATSITFITAIVILVLVNFIFYVLLKSPTRLGRRIMDKIEGFQMYLSTAEEHRLEKLYPPEKTPELFEKYLPYALALEVDQEWSEKFAGVLQHASDEGYSPGWYNGHHWNSLNTSSFASDLGSSLSSAISSSSTAPGSSSGFGGGGSSGGGGGGGGGGGW
jgi:hypothetical protein